MRSVDTIIVGPGPLSFADVVAVARHGAPVELSPDAEVEIIASRKVIEDLAADDEPHYGVSTGFGALATKHIPVDRRAQLQRSLIRSHAAGSGPEVETEVVRALMLLRLSTLASGRTGVRLTVPQTYARMLNAGITPVVHEYGSLGCSGDLAPLAHCALAAMGEGHGAHAQRRPRARGRRPRGGRHPAARPRREGGPGAHQRHRRHARHAGARRRRPGPAAAHRRHHRRDERRGAARHRRGVRRRPAAAAAAPRAGRERGQPARPPGRLGDHGKPPRPGLHPRPGRLLAALLPAGARRVPRHPRPRRDGRVPASWRAPSTTRS